MNCSRSRIAALALALALLLGAAPALAAYTGDAVEAVDLSRSCSLELTYRAAGRAFPGETVTIYPVAELTGALDYALTPAFAASGVDLSAVSAPADWEDAAATLYACAVADGVAGLSQVTDENGKVCFAGLDCGLYLVRRLAVQAEGCTYGFYTFLAAVPTVGSDGKWKYDVSAVPKYQLTPPVPPLPSPPPDPVDPPVTPDPIDPHDPPEPPRSVTRYTVNKVWRLPEGEVERPDAVEIEIYRDGEFAERQRLSAEVDWTYSWTDEGQSEWVVVERNVPDGCTVSITQHETTFTVCNTLHISEPEGEEPPPEDGIARPPTGDTSGYTRYLVIMLASGILLLLLACSGLRARKRR